MNLFKMEPQELRYLIYFQEHSGYHEEMARWTIGPTLDPPIENHNTSSVLGQRTVDNLFSLQ
jgi:hypothetical protein